MSDEMNSCEIINSTIDVYQLLQAIKAANTCENAVLDRAIKATRFKLESFGLSSDGIKDSLEDIS